MPPQFAPPIIAKQSDNFWTGLSFKAKAWIVGIGLFLIIGAVINATKHNTSSSDNKSSPAPQPKPSPEIHAAVRFTGTQFIIINNDAFDWTDVKMEINGGVFSGGYELKHPRIKAKETYTVGALQFANSDGIRFNPFQMKPKKFSICGQTPDGLACYVGGWD